MSWQVAQTYPCYRDTPRHARQFCAEQITGALGPGSGGTQLVQDAVLITSELVTNAVNAGCSTIRLSLEVDERAIRLDVEDDAPGLPDLQDPPNSAPNGRGLLISAQLADNWGFEQHGAGRAGKKVWAELNFQAGRDVNSQRPQEGDAP